MNILLLFPHQLFLVSHFPQSIDRVLLIEEPLFFSDTKYPLSFHKQKLVFHRATMRAYYDYVSDLCETTYIEYNPSNTADQVIQSRVSKDDTVHVFDVADFELNKRTSQACMARSIELIVHDSPQFLNTVSYNKDFFKDKKQMRMHHFYEQQRCNLGILVDENGQPTGGQWSYDAENRKKIPLRKYDTIPPLPAANQSTYVENAKLWVEEKFADNPGNTGHFFYPVNRSQALEWLDDFLETRFAEFGPYEDAMTQQHTLLWHSGLSPLLNCGLLTPQEVIDKSLAYADIMPIELATLEGFIRQIIGWREFMKAAYDLHGVTLRNSNHWQHYRQLSEKWYSGETGLKPLDDVIKRNLNFAYNHHIERLMVVGNVMFLTNTDPNAVYNWFMEMYIDAYDWVMVGNVYGMSQDAIDGLLVTKPYFSGSNYISKMSDWRKDTSGENTDNQDIKDVPWNEIWDALYWAFVMENSDTLAKNHRWAMMVSRARSFDQVTSDSYLTLKRRFIESLS